MGHIALVMKFITLVKKEGDTYFITKKNIQMRSLDEIALSTTTDKNSKNHGYTRYYEMFFESMRNDKIHLCEIGVDEGNSIRMWQEYMPNAIIHGIDIRGGYEYLHDKRTTTLGS